MLGTAARAYALGQLHSTNQMTGPMDRPTCMRGNGRQQKFRLARFAQELAHDCPARLLTSKTTVKAEQIALLPTVSAAGTKMPALTNVPTGIPSARFSTPSTGTSLRSTGKPPRNKFVLSIFGSRP